MADSLGDIEAIVREVIRRLEEMQRANAAIGHGELVAESRVVSLSALPAGWQQAKSLRVPRGAIVTPAVRDELRQRKIELKSGDGSKTAVAAKTKDEPRKPLGRVLIAAAGEKLDVRSWIGLLGDVGRLCQPVEAGDLEQAVAKLGEAIDGQSERAVLLTDRPSAAACLANRRAEVRAAVAWDLASLEESRRSLDVNLLVIDPKKLNLHQTRNLVRRFVQTGP